MGIAGASKIVAVLGYHDGAAGQVETWFESVTGYSIACFIHEAAEPMKIDVAAENRKRVSQRTEFPSAGSFKGRRLIESLDWVKELQKLGIGKVLPLTPDNRTRLRQIETARQAGIELVSAVHPSAIVLAGATMEPGVWVNAGAVIGYKAELHGGVIVNTGVQVDHHNVLERCCQLDPGVITAGNVTLRECCHVHTGATIINRMEIGADAIVGAGAVVIRSIPPGCTAVGVPARVIKDNG
jgi:sugar O-acyltransferase (sialic acid O-acetyltransferase NeuD family)